ncbi:MAG: hypothetical protein JMJ93_08120 [Synergistaceae bacterium]|jgi:hypothetical protein|nr:hypothetical protein [Synergistaceae bacterium]
MKGGNDDPQSIGKIGQLLKRPVPNGVVFESLRDERCGPVWGIDDDRMEELKRAIGKDR